MTIRQAGVIDIDTVVLPVSRESAGFKVRRALPSSYGRIVGPFVLFDQMGRLCCKVLSVPQRVA
jgi:hypothetical protein